MKRARLDGRLAVDDGDAGGKGEDEVGGVDRGVLLDSGKGEVGCGAIGLLDLHVLDDTGLGDDESQLVDPLGHAFGDAGDLEVCTFRGRGDVVELFGELRVAEEESQRRAQIVELFGGCARDLGVAGCVEPREFTVQNEDLAGGLVVRPAHEAGLFEGEGSGLGAVEAHAGVVLGVVGAQGAEVIVMIVDSTDEVLLGLSGGQRGAEAEEREQ